MALRNFHGQNRDSIRRKSESYQHWKSNNKHRFNEVTASLVTSPPESEWVVKSGCHSSCMDRGKGVQVVNSQKTGTNNIQLCSHKIKVWGQTFKIS